MAALLKMNFHVLFSKRRTLGPTRTNPMPSRAAGFFSEHIIPVLLFPNVIRSKNDVCKEKENSFRKTELLCNT